MILIAHRGNVSGKNPDRENTIAFIEEAIDKGFEVEIDLCKWDGLKFYLGHDEPMESVDPEWLRDKPLWVHAKDHLVLHELVRQDIHCFWHDTDRYTITSKGYIWAYPGEPGSEKCICVHPEQRKDWKSFSGVCGDNVIKYKEEIK